MAIQYPNYDSNCSHLFKEVLTKDLFLKIKNRISENYQNTLKPIIQASLENSNHSIGCFLPDPQSLFTFTELFNPIFKFVNEGMKIEDFINDRIIDLNQDKQIYEEISFDDNTYIQEVIIKAKRNLDGFNFNLSLSRNKRNEINEKIINSLKELNLFQTFYYLSNKNIN